VREEAERKRKEKGGAREGISSWMRHGGMGAAWAAVAWRAGRGPTASGHTVVGAEHRRRTGEEERG